MDSNFLEACADDVTLTLPRAVAVSRPLLFAILEGVLRSSGASEREMDILRREHVTQYADRGWAELPKGSTDPVDDWRVYFKDFDKRPNVIHQTFDHFILRRAGGFAWNFTAKVAFERVNPSDATSPVQIAYLACGMHARQFVDRGTDTGATGVFQRSSFREKLAASAPDVADLVIETLERSPAGEGRGPFAGLRIDRSTLRERFQSTDALVGVCNAVGSAALTLIGQQPELARAPRGASGTRVQGSGGTLFANEGKFQGFSRETFSFFDDLSQMSNNNSEWFRENMSRYRGYVRDPFRGLLEDLVPYIRGFDTELETRVQTDKVLGKIQKRGGVEQYHSYYWGAFYQPGGDKRTLPKLFVTVRREGLQAGLDLEGCTPQTMDALVRVLRDLPDLVWRCLERRPHANLSWLDRNVARDGEKNLKVANVEELIAWAQGGTPQVRRMLDATMDLELLSDGTRCLQAVYDAMLDVYPLYKAATLNDVDLFEEWAITYLDDSLETADMDIGLLAKRTGVAESVLDEWLALLDERKQVIFYGPPGTGKTYLAKAIAEHLTGPESSDAMRIVQFHPNYGYEDFMEAIRPEVEAGDARYHLRDGVFKEFCKKAASGRGRTFVLLIDEINRANLPRVFGELLFLLEYRDENIMLPYSNREFRIPDNVRIIGTMNSADRSISLVDYALRRRFAFIPLFPGNSHVQGILKQFLKTNAARMEYVADGLESLNDLLAADGHPEIGHSHFMVKGLTRERLRRIWTYSIRPLLEEYYFDEADTIGQRFNFDRFFSLEDHGQEAAEDPEPGDEA